MDKMKLGGGGRYEKLVSSLESKGVKDPKALAASIGRKKLGKAKFQSLAAKGRRRAEREKANA
jgi:histidyl-tRNA synthetase